MKRRSTMIFQFSFFYPDILKSFETREYLSPCNKISWTMDSSKRSSPVKRKISTRFQIFRLLEPRAQGTNRVISRSVVVFLWPAAQKVRSRVSNEKTLNSKGGRWNIELVSRQLDLTLLRNAYSRLGR